MNTKEETEHTLVDSEQKNQVSFSLERKLYDRMIHAVDFCGYSLDVWMEEIIEAACNMWEDEEETSKLSDEEREQREAMARKMAFSPWNCCR